MERLYKIAYWLRREEKGFSKQELVEKGWGGTDSVLLASVIHPPDGSLDVGFFSIDGATGENMTDAEMWKVWMMLTHTLSKAPNLDDGRRGFCADIFEAIRQNVLAERAKRESEN